MGAAALAGTGALLGLRPRSAAAEPPPETTRLRLLKTGSICWAPQYIADDLLRLEGFTDITYVDMPTGAVSVRLASGEADMSLNFVGPNIIRIEAEDNYVRLWADRPYLHKETLSGLMARLDPALFLRVHRSHAVKIGAVRELRPLLHGEYLIILGNGTEITSGRSYRATIQDAFGLGRTAGGTP